MLDIGAAVCWSSIPSLPSWMRLLSCATPIAWRCGYPPGCALSSPAVLSQRVWSVSGPHCGGSWCTSSWRVRLHATSQSDSATNLDELDSSFHGNVTTNMAKATTRPSTEELFAGVVRLKASPSHATQCRDDGAHAATRAACEATRRRAEADVASGATVRAPTPCLMLPPFEALTLAPAPVRTYRARELHWRRRFRPDFRCRRFAHQAERQSAQGRTRLSTMSCAYGCARPERA